MRVVSQADIVTVLTRCIYINGNIEEDNLDELVEVVSRVKETVDH